MPGEMFSLLQVQHPSLTPNDTRQPKEAPSTPIGSISRISAGAHTKLAQKADQNRAQKTK